MYLLSKQQSISNIASLGTLGGTNVPGLSLNEGSLAGKFSRSNAWIGELIRVCCDHVGRVAACRKVSKIGIGFSFSC